MDNTQEVLATSSAVRDGDNSPLHELNTRVVKPTTSTADYNTEDTPHSSKSGARVNEDGWPGQGQSPGAPRSASERRPTTAELLLDGMVRSFSDREPTQAPHKAGHLAANQAARSVQGTAQLAAARTGLPAAETAATGRTTESTTSAHLNRHLTNIDEPIGGRASTSPQATLVELQPASHQRLHRSLKMVVSAVSMVRALGQALHRRTAVLPVRNEAQAYQQVHEAVVAIAGLEVNEAEAATASQQVNAVELTSTTTTGAQVYEAEFFTAGQQVNQALPPHADPQINRPEMASHPDPQVNQPEMASDADQRVNQAEVASDAEPQVDEAELVSGGQVNHAGTSGLRHMTETSAMQGVAVDRFSVCMLSQVRAARALRDSLEGIGHDLPVWCSMEQLDEDWRCKLCSVDFLLHQRGREPLSGFERPAAIGLLQTLPGEVQSRDESISRAVDEIVQRCRSQPVMTDPVIAADGYTYERGNIEGWLRQHDTSPVTNKTLVHKHLIPNHDLKSAIMESRGRGLL